jgi:hypothetical protein
MATREYIFTQANEAKQLLLTLQNGQHVFDPKGHELATVDKRLNQLLHYRQYTQMYKYAFAEWGSESPEQTYLDVSAEAQELHNLLHSDVFRETLTSLLMIKSELEPSRTLADIHEDSLQQIGQQWVEAGLLRTLQRNDEVDA